MAAKPRNRSAIKGYDRLHRVGVELEGLWKGNHPKAPWNSTIGGGIQRDGSLDDFGRDGSTIYATSDGSVIERGRLPTCTAGEITSNPPIEPLTSVEAMEEFVRKYYPDYVDSTCGLHIHMSTVMRYVYNRLLTPEYSGDDKLGEQGVIFRALEEWAKAKNLPTTHPIWERLRGKNIYCLRLFKGDGQAKTRDKGLNHDATREDIRYTAIAYHWSRRGGDGQPMKTVECRLLPMFETPNLAVEALKVVMRATNDYLNVAVAQKEPTFSFTVPLSKGKSITRRVTRLGRRRVG